MDKKPDPEATITSMVRGLKMHQRFPVSEMLIAALKSSPDNNIQQVAILLQTLEARDQEIMKQINILVDLLEYLRVLVKYQAFDLEATRRERDQFAKMLGEDNR